MYAELGAGQCFDNNRSAVICIVLTLRQQSNGGKVKIGSIGRTSGNHRLRSTLILGVYAVLNKLGKRASRSDKGLPLVRSACKAEGAMYEMIKWKEASLDEVHPFGQGEKAEGWANGEAWCFENREC